MRLKAENGGINVETQKWERDQSENEMFEVVKTLFDNWVDYYCHSYSRTNRKNLYVIFLGMISPPTCPYILLSEERFDT